MQKSFSERHYKRALIGTWQHEVKTVGGRKSNGGLLPSYARNNCFTNLLYPPEPIQPCETDCKMSCEPVS
jgi:hypothetical protein